MLAVHRRTTHLPIAMLVGLIGLLVQRAAICQENDHEELYAMYESVLNNYHSENFDAAIELAAAMMEKYPDEPAGAFGLLTTYQTIRWNYRVKLFETEIDSLLDVCIDLTQKAIKRQKKDGKNYFYLGVALGYRSIQHKEKGKWLDAFKDGSQVKKNFNRAVAYSSDFYDSYYGLGLYNYWFGAKGMMRYLPFAKKNRSEGLNQMNLTYTKGRFLKNHAAFGLMAAYYNEELWQKVIEVSETLLDRYPNNPTLHYRRARTFQAMNEWQKAFTSLQRLEELIYQTPYKSISYKVECLYQKARCSYEMQNYYETKRFCQEALLLEKTCDFTKEIEGSLEKHKDILEQLVELNEKVDSVSISQAPMIE